MLIGLQEENDRLSYSVLVLLYGEEEGIGGVGRRLALVWWKNMYGISEGVSLGVGN